MKIPNQIQFFIGNINVLDKYLAMSWHKLQIVQVNRPPKPTYTLTLNRMEQMAPYH